MRRPVYHNPHPDEDEASERRCLSSEFSVSLKYSKNNNRKKDLLQGSDRNNHSQSQARVGLPPDDLPLPSLGLAGRGRRTPRSRPPPLEGWGDKIFTVTKEV